MNYDIYPVRGSFEPRTQVTFQVENPGSADSIALYIRSIDAPPMEYRTGLAEGKSVVHLPRFNCLFGGFGVEARFCANGAVMATRFTAFDIAPAGQVIRYGFLSDFTPEDGDGADIEAMTRMHINAVQFYDWSYRHDDLVAPTSDYTDMMGKRNDLTVIREKIRQCHTHGMLALGYGAVYAASKGYQKRHPDQGLYNGRGEPLCFIDTFCIMNPMRGNGWHEHILEQYRRAMDKMGFDGIHMDTYGFPKAALDSGGRPQYLDDALPGLIEDAHRIPTAAGKTPFLIFNNVGGWPVSATMSADQQAVYIEVWPPCDQYRHLGALISAGRKSGKPVVLAAYPAPFRTDTPERALESQLLLSFVIAMHGGTQLFFGEENAVITQGYYADYAKLNEEQIQWVRAYQDFFVQYETLLRDDTMEDVSMTHQGWDNQEYVLSPEGSADGEGGKMWYHLRQSRRRKAVYLVNLQNNDPLWNKGKDAPREKVSVIMQVQVLRRPAAVWYASPDHIHGRQEFLHYEYVQTEQSAAIRVKAEVFRCGVVVIEEA